MDQISRAQQETVPVLPHNRLNKRGDRRGLHLDPSVGKRTQFQPGESGNPGGRSRKTPITKLFEDIFNNSTDSDEIKDSMALTLKSGRMAAVLLLREAAERLEGKVTQPIAVDGEITLALAETVQERRKRLGNGE